MPKIKQERPIQEEFSETQTELDSTLSEINISKRDENEAKDKALKIEKVAKFLDRAEGKANRILAILKNSEEVNQWQEDEKELVKKYLTGKDKQTFEDSGLNEKQRESLKNQCVAIIGIVGTRRDKLEDALNSSIVEDANVLKAMDGLDKKILKEDIKQYQIKQEKDKKSPELPDVVLNDIPKKDQRRIADGKSDEKNIPQKSESISDAEKAELEKWRSQVREILSDSEGSSGKAKELPRKPGDGIGGDDKVEDVGDEEYPNDEDLDEEEEITISKETKEQENNRNEKYWAKGFWGRVKMELGDVFRGKGLKQELREDVLGIKENETIGGKFKEAGEQIRMVKRVGDKIIRKPLPIKSAKGFLGKTTGILDKVFMTPISTIVGAGVIFGKSVKRMGWKGTFWSDKNKDGKTFDEISNEVVNEYIEGPTDDPEDSRTPSVESPKSKSSVEDIDEKKEEGLSKINKEIEKIEKQKGDCIVCGYRYSMVTAMDDGVCPSCENPSIDDLNFFGRMEKLKDLYKEREKLSEKAETIS